MAIQPARAFGPAAAWWRPQSDKRSNEGVACGESSCSPGSMEDELSISSEAQAAEAKLGDGEGFPRIHPEIPRQPDGSLRLEDMKVYWERQQAALGAGIRAVFDEAGIDTSQPIQLAMAGDGRVTVLGDHPQKDDIERVFDEHPELRDKFAEVSALGSLIHSAEEGARFSAAYAKDPFAAVEQFSHLFDGSPRPEFTLKLMDDVLSAVYQ
ncbi:MAG: hypothetical protein ACOY3P_12800 [Planctomycetota bacterium]